MTKKNGAAMGNGETSGKPRRTRNLGKIRIAEVIEVTLDDGADANALHFLEGDYSTGRDATNALKDLPDGQYRLVRDMGSFNVARVTQSAVTAA